MIQANLKDAALDEELKQQNWDDSVKSLVSFPQILEMMNEQVGCMQKFGDAFLGQQKGNDGRHPAATRRRRRLLKRLEVFAVMGPTSHIGRPVRKADSVDGRELPCDRHCADGRVSLEERSDEDDSDVALSLARYCFNRM